MIKSAEVRAQLKKIKELKAAVEQSSARSAWGRGVKQYALELWGKYYETAMYCAKNDEPIPSLSHKTL